MQFYKNIFKYGLQKLSMCHCESFEGGGGTDFSSEVNACLLNEDRQELNINKSLV